MSTWTFDRLPIKSLFLIFLAFTLTACGNARFSTMTRSPVSQRSSVEVAGRKLNIKGPPGFCIDRQISEFSEDLAFVLLGSCKAISPSALARAPEVKALLTASISGPGDGGSISSSLVSMDNFFRSETGRTALSRGSDPKSVQVLQTFHQGETFYLRASDNSEGIVPGAADDYWRAYFDLHDQIVSISVIGFEDDPISPDKGLETLQAFEVLLKDQNGIATDPVIAVTKIEEEEPEERQPKRENKVRDTSNDFWTIGILRKLIKS